MTKRILAGLLSLVLLLGAAPAVTASGSEPPQTYDYTVTNATSSVEGLSPNGGSYANSQSYAVWSSPVTSHLAREGEGYLLVTAQSPGLLIERYDSSFSLVSQETLELPLPIYGGVYICEDYNFVVCAQSNTEEDNSKEVYRVIRYSKNWDNPIYCSLYGANTTTAVRFGSLRFARSGDTLLIRTCHEMYRSSDGLCHQANMTMAVSISDMRITDSLYSISNIGRGYVSHSFNQFIQVDGGTIVAADHGDAIPRSIVISKYNSFSVSGRASHVEAFPIADNTGHYNTTGVSLGGFEYSDTHYILAGNSCPQTGGIDQDYAQRNIFVAAVEKNSFSYTEHISYITDYGSGSGISVKTPHLVKTGDNSFCLLWSVSDENKVYYCTLDGSGRMSSEIASVEGYLSDCPPIFVDGDILWVSNYNNGPILHRLSPIHKYTLSHTDPSCGIPGSNVYSCTHCDKSFTELIPALEHEYEKRVEQPNCTEAGTEFYNCTLCGHSYTQTAKPRDHAYGSPEYVDRTCTEPGYVIYTCLHCGCENNTDYSEPLGHSYWRVKEEPGCEVDGKYCRRCNFCGDEVDVEILPATGHNKKPLNEIPGTCVEKGSKNYFCTNCLQQFSEEGDYGDHNWHSTSYVSPSCEVSGLHCYECVLCYEQKEEEIEPTGHDYYLFTFAPASCTLEGSRSYRCMDCGDAKTEKTPPAEHEFQNNVCLYCGRKAAYSEKVNINYRRIKIVLNGQEIIPCDGLGATVEPFIMASNGTTYLPLRAIAQALGLDVAWDAAANTVDLESGGKVKTGLGPAGTSTGLRSANITYRNIRVFLDGEQLSLVNSLGVSVEPFILNSNSSVYLPLRIIGEALGLNVSWDGNTSTVYLSTK